MQRFMRHVMRDGVLAVLCLVMGGAVSAAPYKAVIYPTSAKVWERTQLNVQSDARGAFVEITLPRSVDPNSLVTQIDHPSVQIANVSWQEKTSIPTEDIQQIKTRIEETEAKKRPVEASIQALNARLQFWNSHARFQTQDYAQIKTLAETLTQEIEQTQILLADQTRLDKKLQQTIAELQQQLQQMTVNAEKNWTVRLSLAQADAGTVRLNAEYSYSLGGCGWKSNYRMEGLPDQKLVKFNWESTLWQRSGQDWRDVEISIATLQPNTPMFPPLIPDWDVRPYPRVQPVAAYRSKSLMMEEAPAMMAAGMDSFAEESNTLERLGAFSIWHLGRHSLTTGEETTLQVQQEQWSATFRHLIRPSQSNTAFLEAEIEFAENKDIPAGDAMILLSGAVIGKRGFSLSDNKVTLYFGEDPFVITETKTLERATGKRGLLGGQQALVLSLRTNVRNTQPYPITVRLEEPRPAVGSEQIQFAATFNPQPQPQVEGENIYRWELTLPAQKEQSVNIAYEFKAPKDMSIDWGWR